MFLISIIGSMFSYKTTELIRRCNMYIRSGKRVLRIKPNMDNRYSIKSEIISHDGLSIECIMTDKLLDLNLNYNEYDMIAIDEGHLFPDTYNFIKTLSELNIIIMITGLTMTFKKDVFFDDMLKIVAMSNEINLLKGICNICKNFDAIYSHKLNSSNQSIIDVGSDDKYIPLCRDCFNKLN